MDDFPAGPTGPGPWRPSLSVVIPVRNGGRDFERCLRGLRDSTRTDYELIVVDDASTDDSLRLAQSIGATVLRNEIALGPASARNAGAQAALAPIVFFLDADVVLHHDALEKTLARFDADPSLAALFGSYDDRPEHPGLVSQFRNLLHHYVHQQGSFQDEARSVQTFWTGCGAIRRDVFLSIGGFDPKLYDRPAIEDIELGYRLKQAGFEIKLVRDIQASHLKRWTLRSVVRTDIFQRGVPWTLLMLRRGHAESDLNVSGSQRLGVALTGLTIIAAIASVVEPRLLAVAASLLAMNVAINGRFHQFIAKRRNPLLSVASVFLHQLYYICCGVSVCLALSIWLIGGRKKVAVNPEKLKLVRSTRIEAPGASRPRTTRAKEASRWIPR